MRTVFRSWNDGRSDRCVFDVVYPQFEPRYLPGAREATTWVTINRELERAALTGYVPTTTTGAFDLEQGAGTYIETCRAEIEELAAALGDEAGYVQYIQSVGYGVELLRDELVSLTIQAYSYSGGAHGLPWVQGVTLTIPEGRWLTLGDLVKPEHLKRVIQTARRELRDQWHEALFPEAEAAIAAFVEDASPATDDERETFSRYQQFYLTPEGIVFYWNVYEVAPYAAGHQTVLLPYRSIADWIDPASPIAPLVPGAR